MGRAAICDIQWLLGNVLYLGLKLTTYLAAPNKVPTKQNNVQKTKVQILRKSQKTGRLAA